jgi:hypothetical protein
MNAHEASILSQYAPTSFNSIPERSVSQEVTSGTNTKRDSVVPSNFHNSTMDKNSNMNSIANEN